MIISIEGPDGAGKTTLFNALRVDVVRVASVPFDERLVPVMDVYMRRCRHLWSQLYDPTKVYVVDRGPWLSDLVYSKVYRRGRPYMEPLWFREVRVLLLVGRGDAVAAPVYIEETGAFRHAVVDASRDVASVLRDAEEAVACMMRGT